MIRVTRYGPARRAGRLAGAALAAALASTVFGGAPARADADYSPAEVEEFLRGELDLGKTRGLGKMKRLCIGTAAECDGSGATPAAAAAPAPRSYDLVVTFDFDSANLTAQAKENLRVFSSVAMRREFTDLAFTLEGHTDAVGDETYNLDLSERRAAAVKAFLATLGIEADRIEARGYGEARPRREDPYDPDNRRVETRVVVR